MKVKINKSNAIVASIIPTLFWIITLLTILWLLPDRSWYLKWYGMLISIWIIGVWRYSWQIINAIRAYYFEYFIFPEVRKKCDGLLDKYPENLYVVITSYKEDLDISTLCFSSLISACLKIPSKCTVVASVGSQQEAENIKNTVNSIKDSEKINLLFTLQKDGKRKAIGHALRVIAKQADVNLSNVVVLMDGDSAVESNIFEKSLPVFKVMPNVGALTTNNVALVAEKCEPIVESWYNLKLMKRHHMMMAHSLSNKVLTLTGRFSAFRASIALSNDFINYLEEDYIDDWLYGRIKFLMGDDKSTMFCLLKNFWDSYYVPDAYVVCLENRTGSFYKIANTLMLRWYGNMLRINRKSLAEGLGKMPFFIWFSFIDQRISFWTTLIGPFTAIILSICVSGYYLLFYGLWVIITRLMQLWLCCVIHGHKLKIFDLPLHVFEQWYGALVKIYCQFHLHKQIWQKSRTTSQFVSINTGWKEVIAKGLMGFYVVVFLLTILIFSKLLRLPGLLS